MDIPEYYYKEELSRKLWNMRLIKLKNFQEEVVDFLSKKLVF